MDAILQKMYEYLAENGMMILHALVIFVIGRWVAKIVAQLVEKVLLKSRVDKTLAKFTRNLTQISLLAFVVIAALSKLGVETAQFAVVIGAAGLAIGLALQGSLANFASGFLMIIFRPFKVGDGISGFRWRGANGGGFGVRRHARSCQKGRLIAQSFLKSRPVTPFNAVHVR